MTSQIPSAPRGAVPQTAPTLSMMLLTPQEAGKFLKVSLSWLGKARMRGDGPPYIKFGKSIRYGEAALLAWLKSHQR